jgi:colicin import membrane protein
MSPSSISRAAVAGSLRMARLPLDVAITFLPAGRQPARLAIDRADANVRALAATLLGDEELREDARRRYAAVEARARATRLRGRASSVEERHHEATRRRRAADSRARQRRQQAAERQVRRTKQAARVEGQRLQNSQEVEAVVEEAIEEEAPRARLEALEKAAEAQREQEQALAQADEAQRLREAAERVKEQRKQS